MADPTLVYRSIASARTSIEVAEEADARPIRDYMPLPFEGIKDLVREDLGQEIDDEELAEFVQNRNAKIWTEKLKNVTVEPVVRDDRFMQDSFQWECRRLAGFVRPEKSPKAPKANLGTLENVYSVVQKIPQVVWEALTGSNVDLSEKSASELKVLTRESLNSSDWTATVVEQTDSKIVWEFTRDGTRAETEGADVLTVVGTSKKGKLPKSSTSIAISAGNLASRKFGAYLDHVLDIDSNFREIATIKQLQIKNKKLSMKLFDVDVISDDFLEIGNVEIEQGSIKYDAEVLKCMQVIFNDFREKNLTLTNKLPPDFSNLEEAMRGKKVGEGFQNLLSKSAIAAFSGSKSASTTLDDIDERRRVHGKQIWVMQDEKVVGLLWVKKYKKTRWAEWFKREFNSNVDTSQLDEEFSLPTSTPPFSGKKEVKSKIDDLLAPENGLYIEVCHVQNDPKLTLLLNLFGMMLFGRENLFAVSNIPPLLSSADDEYNTDVWRADRLGPRVVPDPSLVLDLETYLGFQKTFDLRMNIMKSEDAEPQSSLNDIYHVKTDFAETFLLPPVYWLKLQQESDVFSELTELMWQDDFMFFNDTWPGVTKRINADESRIRGLFRLSATELLYSEYKKDKVFNPSLGEYIFKRAANNELITKEAYQISNYNHERVDGATAAENFIKKNTPFKTTRFRNGTLSPRLIHYEMTRFLPNLNEIRTMCAILAQYKETIFDMPDFKSARSPRSAPRQSARSRISGGSVCESACSTASDLTDLIRKMQDEIEVKTSLEPIVEMDIGVDVSAGLNI